MKILFVGGGSPATIFGIAPLATAARAYGHEVFMAANEEMVPVITGIGLPALCVAEHDIWHYIDESLEGRPPPPDDSREFVEFVGSWFARLGADGFAVLRDVCRHWRPDLVVGGTMCYAAPLLAAHLGIPYVWHAWDTSEWIGSDDGAHRVLRPELTELGLERLPEPDLRIEVYPPSLAPPNAPDAQLMRWVPGNLQSRLEPWMFTRPGRPRVCLTAGSRADRERNLDGLRRLAGQIAASHDVEIVIPAPEKLAVELRAALPGVRCGWIPMDVIAPTCDLIVHHAGGSTTMAALNVGVPQLVIPESESFLSPVRRVADFGAAITLSPREATDEAVRGACRELLLTRSYRERAQALSAEIAALPPPPTFVPRLEKLADR